MPRAPVPDHRRDYRVDRLPTRRYGGKRRLPVYLDDPTFAALDAQALARGLSRAGLAEQLLRRSLERLGPRVGRPA